MKGAFDLPAPGDLELVRALLNTWVLPSATRRPEDRLPALAGDHAVWAARFPGHAPPAPQEVAELVRLRDDLRAAIASGPDQAATLDEWFARLPPRLRYEGNGDRSAIGYAPAPGGGFAAVVVAAVAAAVAADAWPRLKVCPDCRWVFYDRSRSRTRVWCDMVAGDGGGRACGTIAKVRRYRERNRAGASAADVATDEPSTTADAQGSTGSPDRP